MAGRSLSLILAILMLLTGCVADNSTDDSGEKATVYYTGKSNGGLSEPLIASQITLQDGTSGEDAVLEALWAAPAGEGRVSVMPVELKVVDWDNERGKMKLWLSDYYLEMSGIGKTIATAALVHSLCSLEAVDSLAILVGENEIYVDMTGENLLLYDKEADPYEREVKVFFSDDRGEFLYDYTYIYTVGGEEIIEEYVMDVLLGGDLPEGAVSYIPEGTGVNEVYVVDEVCTLDLSADFYEGRPRSPVTERAVIYSIVNTLTALSGIKSVKFLIDGETLDYYVTIPLDKPIERTPNMRWDSGGTKVSVFMWSDVLSQLVEFPVVVTDEQETKARYILAAVNGWGEEAGYTNPVPAATGFFSDTQISDNMATIDLSAEFHGSPAGDSAENTERAINALASSLMDVYLVDSIKIICKGQDLRVDGVNLSLPISADDLN